MEPVRLMLKSPLECRVLVVDDSRVLCLMVEAMFQKESDITVAFCTVASEAMSKALSFKPTVILQDLVMPDVEGLEMVRLFKDDSRTQEIPLVMPCSTKVLSRKHLSENLGLISSALIWAKARVKLIDEPWAPLFLRMMMLAKPSKNHFIHGCAPLLNA